MDFSLFDQLSCELRSFAMGYPDFVYKPRVAGIRAQRPVFVFHTIDADEFDEQLVYLRDNVYSTLSTEEYLEQLKSLPSSGIDAVLLTVDDGRSSFWRYGYPLLKRYGMKATLFIIPGRTHEADKRRLNLEDAWAGRCSLGDVYREDPDDVSLCTWAEIKEMYESGLVDIQSHSLFHREVFAEPVLQDFIDTSTSFSAYETPVTPYLGLQHAGQALDRHEFIGLPLYAAAPLYRGEISFRPSEQLAAFCRRYCLESGSRLGTASWKAELRKAIDLKFPDGGLIQETREEAAQAIRSDLIEATAMIQQELDKHAGTHFCFPYSAGSDMAVKLVKEVGMKSCFWGVIPGQRANLADADPWHLVRIKSDFLWRLPGRGRDSLFGTYWRKVRRRVRGQRFY